MNRIWLGDTDEVDILVGGNVLPSLCGGRDKSPEWLKRSVPLESSEIGRACGPGTFLI